MMLPPNAQSSSEKCSRLLKLTAGLSAARDRGRVGGRPSSLTAAKKRQANKMRGDGVSMTEIAEVLNVARSTLYRNLQ